MKKRFPVVLLSVCLVFLLLMSLSGGCAPRPAAQPEPVPAAPAPQPQEPAAPAGEPIIIGSALPTGFLYGWAAERGIRLAAEEINAAGGVDVGGVMRPLMVEVLDTRDLEPGVPTSDALLAVERLILERNANFLIGGPARSEAALAAMDLIGRHKTPTIFTTGFLSGRFMELMKENYDTARYSFRISSTAGTMVGEMLTLFDSLQKDRGFNKVMIKVQDVAHARGGGDIMAKQLADRGWEVAGPEIYPTGTLDFSPGLFKAKDFGAQVLFIWMDMPESSILMRQWHDMQLPALPLGFINAAEQPGFWEATAGKGEFTVAHLVNAGNAPCEATPLTMDFVRAYEQKWGLEPEGYGTSSSYQAVYTLVDAIERAGSIEPDAVVEAMKTTDLVGVYGRVRFNEQHQIIAALDPAEGAVPQIIQWQAGKRETVFPPAIATSELKLPPWMQ